MMIATLAKKFNWILREQYGLNLPKLVRGLKRTPIYLIQLYKFRASNQGTKVEMLPCLHDATDLSSGLLDEYFWQDILVSRMTGPLPGRKLDIGSRVDGFVAQMSHYGQIDVADIRENPVKVEGINFVQLDITSNTQSIRHEYDVVTSLHTFEHLGLGRYGDEINSHSLPIAFKNVYQILKVNGTFFMTTLIGAPRVCFNAHRIYDKEIILGCAEKAGFSIKKQYVIKESIRELEQAELYDYPYSLILFEFEKLDVI